MVLKLFIQYFFAKTRLLKQSLYFAAVFGGIVQFSFVSDIFAPGTQNLDSIASVSKFYTEIPMIVVYNDLFEVNCDVITSACAGAMTSSGTEGGARELWGKVDPNPVPNPSSNPNPISNPFPNPILNPNPNPISSPIAIPILIFISISIPNPTPIPIPNPNYVSKSIPNPNPTPISYPNPISNPISNPILNPIFNHILILFLILFLIPFLMLILFLF